METPKKPATPTTAKPQSAPQPKTAGPAPTTTTDPKPDAKAPAPTIKQFTVNEIAKEAGVKPAVARRFLRAAGIKRPKDGWSWTDKASARDAIEAVTRAAKAKPTPTRATPPPKAPTGPLGRA